MVDVIGVLWKLIEDILYAIPSILAAIVVILIGYAVGSVVGKAVNMIVEKLGMEKKILIKA